MKKYISVFTIMIMIFLAACSNQNTSSTPTSNENNTQSNSCLLYTSVKGIDSSEQILQFAFLFGQSGHLLKYAGRDMVAPGQAGAFAALQIREFLNHVFPELILPPGQLLLVTHNVFWR